MGLTYSPEALDAMHAQLPLKPLMNGESASCQSAREDEDFADVVACSAAAWAPANARVWDAGAFAWSGYDYRGETSWPNVVSFYGALDLCGFGKGGVTDFYSTWWGAAAGWPSAATAVAASPAWGPPPSGSATVTITAQAALPGGALELAVNGLRTGARQAISHLGAAVWRGIAYSPGNYTITSFDASGAAVGSFTSRSPGAAVALRAVVDWPGRGAGGALVAGARDAALVAVSVVDAGGEVVRSGAAASANLSFAVSGPGELLGLGNGAHDNHEPGQGGSWVLAYGGRARAMLRSASAASGQALTLTVSAEGLAPASVQLGVV